MRPLPTKLLSATIYNCCRGEKRMVEVYVDVLVCINLLITYIFVVCTRVALNIPTNKCGVCIGSIVGGFSSLIIFCDEMNIAVSILYKLGIASVIVAVCFLPNSLKRFFKLFSAFLGISLFFGGAMYFTELAFKPHGVLYLNGTVYFDMDIKYLVGSTFIIYGIFIFVNNLLEKRAARNEIYNVVISFRGITIHTNGFVDTGNNLTDSLTGRKVFVGTVNAFAPLFSYEEVKYLKNADFDNIPETLKGKIRFIPCQTVSDSSLLPAFTPDVISVKINEKKLDLKDFCVALINKNISDGDYDILLNRAIYDM